MPAPLSKDAFAFAANHLADSRAWLERAKKCQDGLMPSPLCGEPAAEVWPSSTSVPAPVVSFKAPLSPASVAVQPPGDEERTIATDDKLASLLADELVYRRVKGDATIALVGQWDTAYSRSLAKLISQQWCETAHPPQKGSDSCDRVYSYNYLRGIDGQVPGIKPKDKAESDSKTEPKDIERADGDAQIDYLRRMRDALVAEDGRQRQECGLLARLSQKCGIRAIGVLGNDYFDKLLVLQALKPVFPTAVFFTTDLHADMLHPQHNPFTRNLVVASGFGLTLPGDQQNRIPPLRDSYQAAVLHTVRLVASRSFGASSRELSAPPPRLFEIGRTEAVELPRPPAPQPQNAAEASKAAESDPAPLPYYHVLPHGNQGWYIALSAVLAICLALLPLCRSRHQVTGGHSSDGCGDEGPPKASGKCCLEKLCVALRGRKQKWLKKLRKLFLSPLDFGQMKNTLKEFSIRFKSAVEGLWTGAEIALRRFMRPGQDGQVKIFALGPVGNVLVRPWGTCRDLVIGLCRWQGCDSLKRSSGADLTEKWKNGVAKARRWWLNPGWIKDALKKYPRSSVSAAKGLWTGDDMALRRLMRPSRDGWGKPLALGPVGNALERPWGTCRDLVLGLCWSQIYGLLKRYPGAVLTAIRTRRIDRSLNGASPCASYGNVAIGFSVLIGAILLCLLWYDLSQDGEPFSLVHHKVETFAF